MQLKRYQIDTLSVLQRFLEDSRVAGPRNAYETITQEPELSDRLGRYGGSYTTPFEDLPDVPYVCLRLPTGGGKTILGAHAVRIARDAWIDRDYPLVLWLVPTNTIRQQTVHALKDARHPYRQVLDGEFKGRVRIFDISDFTHVRPQDLRDSCCIVVGTIQTLRVTNTEGRRVYAHNEELEPHFWNLHRMPPGLEESETGGVKFSFANLMHLQRPLLIVDEAHNAMTGLTREMQERLNPSAIVEFTATPKSRSNILYSVTAQELKSEEMVKLPIMLSENDTWQSAVNGAVAKRAELAEIAGNEGSRGYIRPIVLFQAQRRNNEVTVESLKNHLVDTERVPENKIAVATGNQRDLDGIDLFDPQCPIEYIITVEALREGWDCSFAYVFCSVSRIQSAQNVEQLFGRVLRMPYAKRRQHSELNRAYAYVSEPSFGDAARALVDKLVNMGFEEDEAQDNIQSELPRFGVTEVEAGLFDLRDVQRPTFRHALTASPEILSGLRRISHEGLSLRELGGGELEITVTGGIDANLEGLLTATVPESERWDLTGAVEAYRRQNRHLLSDAERGEQFGVPRLMSEIQGSLEFADTDIFMEYHDWSLLNHAARLDEREFSIRETARSFEIDIDGRRVRHHFVNEYEQYALNVAVEGWTAENLVIWLDRQVHQTDMHQDELLKWLSDLMLHLTIDRGMHITALTRCKFLLARTIRDRLNVFRAKERRRAYQHYLLDPSVRIEVSFDAAFSFKDGMYRDRPRYRGHWRPNKHFLGADQVPAFDGADDGEEVRCAQALDSLPEVKYWIRNVARHPDSFWLPTVTGRFYPDLIALLNDGRYFVVEYKGAHIAEGSDTAEKRTIGELWERQSARKGIFLVAERQRDGLDVRNQLQQKISSTPSKA